MGRSTLARDYDIAYILATLQRDVADLKRRVTGVEGFPGGFAEDQSSASQNVVASSPAVLPNDPVSATLDLRPGRHRILAMVSGLIGSGVTFNPTSVGRLTYRLSGAITYNPPLNGVGVGGENLPISNGGGTSARVHAVTLASAGSVTIDAMGARSQAQDPPDAPLVIRDVRVQLIVIGFTQNT